LKKLVVDIYEATTSQNNHENQIWIINVCSIYETVTRQVKATMRTYGNIYCDKKVTGFIVNKSRVTLVLEVFGKE